MKPDVQLKNPFDSNNYSLIKKELATKGFSEFRFLGKGAQGFVILAKHSSTNNRYAIKGV